jgi:L-xylulokinase
MAKYLMGIDDGSTMIKVGIFSLRGEEIAVGTAKCEMTSPRSGWYERDMNGIWEANVKAIRDAVSKANIDASDIAAVSLTGHGNGAHFVDERGGGVRNSVESLDNRGQPYADKWASDGTFKKIHPRGLQALWPALSVCVFAWFRDNEPETLDRTKWLLNVKDYVRMKLTGEAWLEYSDSSGAGFINTSAGTVDPAMLADMGLAGFEKYFPPMKYATDKCGTVTETAARETGLAPGTPVAAGCYDIDTAALASGVTDESYLNVIVGSWANNQLVSKTPIISEDLFSTTIFAIEGYHLMLEGSPCGAVNLEWFTENLLAAEKTSLSAGGKSVYDVCNAAVAETRPDESDIVFLPFLYGSNAASGLKSAFFGVEGWHTRKHLIRAVYEGVCFSHRWHIDRLAGYGPLPAAARIAGGAARTEVWLQMFADVLDMPIETTMSSELGTLGAAMCASVCAGVYGSLPDAVRGMVRVKDRIEPNPPNAAIYDKKYANYLRAIEAARLYHGA